MLKKLLALSFLLFAGITQAGQYDDTTFNVGIELSFINISSYNDGQTTTLNAFKTSNTAGKLALQKNTPGVNVFLGARFTENWGGQVGFSFLQTLTANVQNGQQASNKISNIFLDVLGFINIARNLDMMGLLGYGMLKSNPSVTNTFIYQQSALTKRRLGVRCGCGFQYNFCGPWSSRGMIIYQKGNPAFLKSLISFSIGILYSFY